MEARTQKFILFDVADYLENTQMMAEYLSAAVEEPNPDVFLVALGDVARARGMAQIAEDASLGRESLYKALRTGAHPCYETVSAVIARFFHVTPEWPKAGGSGVHTGCDVAVER